MSELDSQLDKQPSNQLDNQLDNQLSEQLDNQLSEQPSKQESEVANIALDFSEAAQQVLDGLNALDNLSQLAIGDRIARDEARRQLGKVAQGVQAILIAPPYQSGRQELADKLSKLSLLADIEMLDLTEKVGDIATIKLDKTTQKMLERLADYTITSPSDKNKERDAGENEVPNKRRVIVASLDSGDSYMRATVEVSRRFNSEVWQVMNLGANAPIMALTSSVMDFKPAVLVLLLHRPNLIQETRRLIVDLKRSLYGLKILTAGPLFDEQAGLGRLLGADVYGPQLDQVVKLAEQVLSPLKERLGDPLTLEEEDLPKES